MLTTGAELEVVVESDRLVAFGDGIESDSLSLIRGQTVQLRAAARRLRLVAASPQRRGTRASRS